MKNDELSPKMLACIEHMKCHNNKLVRWGGKYSEGFWYTPFWIAGPNFWMSTIEELVTSGVAKYTAWKDECGGKFPIEVTLKDGEHGL